ncbi:hypothetical protein TPHV1_200021 [Treponema phagedenis]|uniref:Uncharacterized protein n=1 Tax=Treponema phagedenis TaxID=162 RepID=A0A0B7GYI4_TREPH|nr:hypothetical protein TPHV1_200021 [Treponema phagedenis]
MGIETFFFINPVISGTVAHSQTGKINPLNKAVKKPIPLLFGNIFMIN